MIECAVVPVAGIGTRLLPATKSQPKEMLPVARKPIVQFVVEELVANGIRQVLFVTGRGKASIENHFDRDPELDRALERANRKGGLHDPDTDALGAQFFYTRQRYPKGLGDAVACGERFAGGKPFVVALGDSILGLNALSKSVSRMTKIFESKAADCVIAVETIPLSDAPHYGIVQPAGDAAGDFFEIADLVEKPSPEKAPSNLAVAGRYVFSPAIFPEIGRVQPDRRGEVQLTDAIRLLCKAGRRVVGYRLPPGEKRYDIGNFPSYYMSFVEFALADPLYGAAFRRDLEQMLRKESSRKRGRKPE